VKCELAVTSGARAGHRDVFEKSYIAVGRHPMSDLRFDAEKDIDASSRHAAVVRVDDHYVLRDLGSTNGTFVNGERLTEERRLQDGDVLRFGLHGPEATFRLVRDAGDGEVVMAAVHAPPAAQVPRPEAAPAARPAAKPTPATMPPAALAAPAAPSKTSVLRAELGRQRSRVQAIAATLIVIFLGAIAVIVWQGRKSQQVTGQLTSQLDSLTQELAALRRLQAQTDSQKTAIEAELARERDPSRQAALRTQLGAVTRRSTAIQAAQGVDYTAIRAANDRAVAIIYVRFADTTQMWTGTGFVVTPAGLMLTNRHVVQNERGEQPRDIAIQFSGSREVHPARLVRVHPTADLATVQLESQGPFPVVAGLADGTVPAAGDPIALIGFPGGGGEARVPSATLVTGSVLSTVVDSLLELDAFSGVGASGSPIFDRNGRVVGVEFGGRQGSGGRTILGLPIARASSLLQP
jgi:S1-C subfamily serine protease